MKLLLTSNGLSNDSIATAFAGLIGKEPKDSKVAFIPTAANAERGNKSWLIDDLYRLKSRGYFVDIIELTATNGERLKEALEDMDAIFVGGGNTFYLSYWMQKSGLFDMLPELLQTKVYAGISAGSIVAGESLTMDSQALENPQAFKDEDYDLLGPEGESSGKTLQLVNFLIRPHLNSGYFSLARKELLEEKAKDVKAPIYAIDDNSAVKVTDGSVKVISEGEWLVLNDNPAV
jgi:dipeptidase E